MQVNQTLAAIEAQNERTLERVAQFRLDYAAGTATFDDFSKLKHEFPFIGFVPCSAGGIDFVIFHANDDIVGWEYLWFGDDYYELLEREHCLRGRRTRRTFRVGDPVRIVVAGVSVERRQVDFLLAGGEDRMQGGWRRRRRSS